MLWKARIYYYQRKRSLSNEEVAILQERPLFRKVLDGGVGGTLVQIIDIQHSYYVPRIRVHMVSFNVHNSSSVQVLLISLHVTDEVKGLVQNTQTGNNRLRTSHHGTFQKKRGPRPVDFADLWGHAGFPGGPCGKESTCQCRRPEWRRFRLRWSLFQEDPLEDEMATHSRILAWRIPWTEEPGRLQSMGSQRVRHN